jgi:hypothetical protein
LPACRAFTRKEWLEPLQGKLLAATPVIEIEKIADGPRVPFTEVDHLAAPLQGVRVLDFTHVLAGPRWRNTARTFFTSALLPIPTLSQHLGVDIGKRCAYLDLRNADDLAQMHELARTADVFTSTYRSSVNKRFRLEAHELATRSERGIVCMAANAYGHSGPWADRPGFDQNWVGNGPRSS